MVVDVQYVQECLTMYQLYREGSSNYSSDNCIVFVLIDLFFGRVGHRHIVILYMSIVDTLLSDVTIYCILMY